MAEITEFTSIGNNRTIELEKHNPNTAFPSNGIYIGEFENLLKDKFPALLYLSQTNGLCFLTTPKNREKIHTAMQSIALRILLEIPNGLAKLKMYDATGLGVNLIHLAQVSEKIKGENILTDTNELKRMLQNVVSEIPTIIQKVLGHKYRDKTLIEYNKLAGELAKAYHFLLITDYPHSFNEETNQQLLKVLQSGKRAGFFTFLSVDTSYEQKRFSEINPLEITTKLPCIYEMDGSFYIKGLTDDNYFNQKFKFHLNTDIPKNLDEIIDYINSSAKQVKKVEVSLLNKLTERNFWSKNSGIGLETPIGKLNFTDVKDFILSIEDGDTDNPNHCLIGGATGSGKTVLLHNIICNTAWLYSPDEVEFYLLDYKQGTEFKVYQNLPHVKVLSVKSEREFGVSVLDYLDRELNRRSELFKDNNVSKIAKYNEVSNSKLSRIIVIIDEFQKLLDGDTKIANYVSKALDNIGRQGRSYGIHLILATQSLSGVNITQVLSHLGLRITLKLNTTRDCDQLLGFGNNIPFTFTKKGEAVYNSRSGLTEGNSRFQVAYIPDNKMKVLIDDIRKKSDKKYGKLPFKQFIYDGSLKPNTNQNLDYKNNTINNNISKVYIGEPVTLQEEHIYYKFRKQNESNVLMVGKDIETAVSVFKHSFYQTQNQSSKESEFYIFNKLNVDSKFYNQLETLDNTIVLSTDKLIENKIDELFNELQERINGKETTNRIVFGFFNIYNIRSLRKNGMMQSTLGKKLNDILIDGSSYNMHTLIYSSSYQRMSNVIDTMKSMNNFDTKIALKGGEGTKLFGIASNDVIENNGIGMILSPFTNNPIKFKAYNI